jgi:CheY-like chemotaxis protein
LYEQSPGVVLIVDDNEVNLMIAGALMESLGYEVEVALDGAQALTACHRRAPDAVLMDVHMPVMDGLQATRQLRAEQRIGELPPFPVVAATTADDAQTLAQCRDAGMDGILAKPLSPQLLADEIHRVLPARAAPHRH